MQGVNSLGPKFLPVCPSLPNPTVVVFNDGIEVITKIKRVICFFCEEKATEGRLGRRFATEGRLSRSESRSICHGRTRNYTETRRRKTSRSHGRKIKQKRKQKRKQKHLPRINTELHGRKNKQKQKISDGNSIP